MQPDELGRKAGSLPVVDVREDDEWAAGHMPGAVHIPMGQVPGRLDDIGPGAPVVVVCRSGNRSDQVTRWLRGQGVEAENLEGGMREWAALGLPVVLDDGSPGTVV